MTVVSSIAYWLIKYHNINNVPIYFKTYGVSLYTGWVVFRKYWGELCMGWVILIPKGEYLINYLNGNTFRLYEYKYTKSKSISIWIHFVKCMSCICQCYMQLLCIMLRATTMLGKYTLPVVSIIQNVKVCFVLKQLTGRFSCFVMCQAVKL